MITMVYKGMVNDSRQRMPLEWTPTLVHVKVNFTHYSLGKQKLDKW